MTPNVIFRSDAIFQNSFDRRTYSSIVAARAKANAVKKTENQHPTAPPNWSVQIRKHYICQVSRCEFVQPVAEDHRSVCRQRNPDKEPDRTMSRCSHLVSLPEVNVQCTEHHHCYCCPEPLVLIERHRFF